MMHLICVLGYDQQDYFRQKDSKGSILALLGLKNTLTTLARAQAMAVANEQTAGESRPNGLGPQVNTWF